MNFFNLMILWFWGMLFIFIQCTVLRRWFHTLRRNSSLHCLSSSQWAVFILVNLLAWGGEDAQWSEQWSTERKKWSQNCSTVHRMGGPLLGTVLVPLLQSGKWYHFLPEKGWLWLHLLRRSHFRSTSKKGTILVSLWSEVPFFFFSNMIIIRKKTAPHSIVAPFSKTAPGWSHFGSTFFLSECSGEEL